MGLIIQIMSSIRTDKIKRKNQLGQNKMKNVSLIPNYYKKYLILLQFFNK